MARMLYASRPGHGTPCRRARKRCTCYYTRWGRKADLMVKRANRLREKREVRFNPDGWTYMEGTWYKRW